MTTQLTAFQQWLTSMESIGEFTCVSRALRYYVPIDHCPVRDSAVQYISISSEDGGSNFLRSVGTYPHSYALNTGYRHEVFPQNIDVHVPNYTVSRLHSYRGDNLFVNSSETYEGGGVTQCSFCFPWTAVGSILCRAEFK
jgi:hypothetical protein